MATATKCQHGLEAGSCLICATLEPAKRGRAIPTGKPEVITGGPRRRGGLGAVGWLVVLVAAAFGVWFLVHLVWGVLHLVELALVGVVCGVLGYRIGVFVGRHRR